MNTWKVFLFIFSLLFAIFFHWQILAQMHFSFFLTLWIERFKMEAHWMDFYQQFYLLPRTHILTIVLWSYHTLRWFTSVENVSCHLPRVVLLKWMKWKKLLKVLHNWWVLEMKSKMVWDERWNSWDHLGRLQCYNDFSEFN